MRANVSLEAPTRGLRRSASPWCRMRTPCAVPFQLASLPGVIASSQVMCTDDPRVPSVECAVSRQYVFGLFACFVLLRTGHIWYVAWISLVCGLRGTVCAALTCGVRCGLQGLLPSTLVLQLYGPSRPRFLLRNWAAWFFAAAKTRSLARLCWWDSSLLQLSVSRHRAVAIWWVMAVGFGVEE